MSKFIKSGKKIFPDEIPSESSEVMVVDDEPKRRMQELSMKQMESLYGKGLKLLQKVGFSDKDALGAPIKVLLRKPREG